MALDKELLALDANKILAVAEKVLSQIPTEGAFLSVPEKYVALNALITRSNQMSEVVSQKMDEEQADLDEETIGFLRGITAGVWIAAAVLLDYAQITEFETQFDADDPEPNDT